MIGFRSSDVVPDLKNIVNDRDDRGVTFALFKDRLEGRLSRRKESIVRRMLSLQYVRHYRIESDSSIVWGIRGVQYYDKCIDNRSFYTYIPLLSLLSRRLGFERIFNTQESFSRIARINSYFEVERIGFAREFRRFAYALDAWAVGTRKSPYDLMMEIGSLEFSNSIISGNNHAAALRVAIEILVSWGDKFAARSAEFSASWGRERREKVRALVLTATDKEDDAFERVVDTRKLGRTSRDATGNWTIRGFGRVGGVELYHVRISAGSLGRSGSSFAVPDVIKRANPDYIIPAGICFGLKRDKQDIGDIILSQRVHNYEPGRQGDDELTSRGETIECSPLLLNRAREAISCWKGAAVHTGLLVSGEKLVDSPKFRAELLRRQPEALGGEMEAAGVVTAAESHKKDWLICKGIADWGEGKVDGDQVGVAQTAIEFALMIVERIK